ncbi:Uu.00g134140.m01.CDS01 [Anthostomella pinea]|uniref:Uu.00g134140.m01.CDS01 n=1 Tax=Anthostomella pinea TaxID=933095 RepID=A0AAI8YKX2_9PEZI|nr:Uu.00g134140.m01.CDS01 [Anthostomella pinea]
MATGKKRPTFLESMCLPLKTFALDISKLRSKLRSKPKSKPKPSPTSNPKPQPKPWVRVNTTIPLPHPDIQPPVLKTARLTIRPLTLSDLHAYHALRRQPAAMTYSTYARPDLSLTETTAKLLTNIPTFDPNSNTSNSNSNNNYYFGIFLSSTNQLIGEGGVHTLSSPMCGWPELGYKFGVEHWGCGYGTEFVRGFLGWWWVLHREVQQKQVYGDSVVGKGGRGITEESASWCCDGMGDESIGEEEEMDMEKEKDMGEMGLAPGLAPELQPKPAGARGEAEAAEQICAWTAVENRRSQWVLIKAGFRPFMCWEWRGEQVIGWRSGAPALQNRHKRR